MHVRAMAAAVALAATLWAATPLPVAASAVWLAAGDVHLDPFDRSAVPAPPGKDSNSALLASAIRAMRAADPDPAVVLLTGDFLAHHWAELVRQRGGGATAEDAAAQAMRAMAAAFGRAFPRAAFVLALGNNDAPCGDYRSDPQGRFVRETALAWAPLVDRHGSSPGFARGIAGGGYYTVQLPAQRLQLVVLDTVLFSQEYRGACAGGDSAAAALSWLRTTLRAVPPGTRNVVLMHVPPGYDAFSTEFTHGFLPWPYLNARDNAELVQVLDDARSRVAFSIAGHAHRFDVRLFGGAPLIVLGSISPVYRNDPVFYRLRVGDGLEDLAAYAYDRGPGRWRGPDDFDRTWRVERLDTASLARVHARLAIDPVARTAWGAASVAWAEHLPRRLRVWRASTWRIPWCAQTLPADGFAGCAGIEHRAAIATVAIVAVGLLALVGVAAAAVAVARVLRAGRQRKGSVPKPE